MILNRLFLKSVDELRKAGIKTADIDVRVILRYVLEKDDVYLLTHHDELLTNAQYQKFRRLIRRRLKGEPVAYLTKQKEFYGLNFIVNKNVLIPRPETEVLVDEGLKFLQNFNSGAEKELNIIDIGTGSGCIIISLARGLSDDLPQNLRLYATDISARALAVARKNADLHHSNIRFHKSDLLFSRRLPDKFHLIVANLPYLTEDKKGLKYSDPGNIGLAFEPSEALYAKDDGFALIEKLLVLLPHRLAGDGVCLLEVDEAHSTRLKKLCEMLKLKPENISGNSPYQGFWSIKKWPIGSSLFSVVNLSLATHEKAVLQVFKIF